MADNVDTESGEVTQKAHVNYDEDDQTTKSYEEESEEESEEEEEGEEVSESKETEKSLSVSDLIKAVDAYEAVEDVLTEVNMSREDCLKGKLDSGTISKAERVELAQIWIGSDEDSDAVEEHLAKSVVTTLEEEGNVEFLDASDFLKSLVSGIDTRMDGVEKEVLRDGVSTRSLMKAQGQLLKGVASVIAQQDEIIKALADRLNIVENAPAARRSVVTNAGSVVDRGLAKSAIGAHTDQLTKSEVGSGLRKLMLKAGSANDEAAMDSIVEATALFEQTGDLPQSVLRAIQKL